MHPSAPWLLSATRTIENSREWSTRSLLTRTSRAGCATRPKRFFKNIPPVSEILSSRQNRKCNDFCFCMLRPRVLMVGTLNSKNWPITVKENTSIRDPNHLEHLWFETKVKNLVQWLATGVPRGNIRGIARFWNKIFNFLNHVFHIFMPTRIF